MIVKLFDRTEIIVTKRQGELLGNSLGRSNDGVIKIGNAFFKKSAIAAILPGGRTEADLAPAKPTARKLGTGDTALAYDVARKKAAEVRAKLIKKGVIKK